MAKELNDKELKNLNGGEGGILTRDTIDKLGLTVHDRDYCCDSYVLTPRDANKIYLSSACSNCMYSTFIIEPDGSSMMEMACLLGK